MGGWFDEGIEDKGALVESVDKPAKQEYIEMKLASVTSDGEIFLGDYTVQLKEAVKSGKNRSVANNVRCSSIRKDLITAFDDIDSDHSRTISRIEVQSSHASEHSISRTFGRTARYRLERLMDNSGAVDFEEFSLDVAQSMDLKENEGKSWRDGAPRDVRRRARVRLGTESE